MTPAEALQGPEAMRRAEATSWVGLGVQAVVALACAAVAAWTGSRAAGASAALAIAGLLPWICAIAVFGSRRRAARERTEIEALRERAPESGIFGPEGGDVWSAASRLRRVERGFVPILEAAAGIGEAGLALAFFLLQGRIFPAGIENGPPGAAVLAGAAFFAFLAGRFAAGMASEPAWRLLRAPAGSILAVAVASLGSSVALALAHSGAGRPDRILAACIAALLALLAVEKAIAAILNAYRPRAPGTEVRPVIDSRLLGLLAEPAGVLRTVALTLDEQFGFRISETWFYRFLERAILPLVLFEILALWLVTAVVWIDTGRRGYVEHLSRRAARVLGPGIHGKWPWPIDRAYVAPADEIHVIEVGAGTGEHEEGHGHGHAIDGGPILWTAPHGGPGHMFLVASREEAGAAAVPANLVSLSLRLHYRVRDLLSYSYRVTDPDALLRSLARRELICHVAGVDFLSFLAEGRVRAAPVLRERIQDAADRARLGVEILHVSIPNAHPPPPVAPAFEGVVDALEEKEAEISKAEAYRTRAIAQARQEAYARVREAEAYREAHAVRVAAEANRFLSQREAWRASRAHFRLRAYLDALREATAGARKYVFLRDPLPGDAVILDARESAITPLDASLGLEPAGGGAGEGASARTETEGR